MKLQTISRKSVSIGNALIALLFLAVPQDGWPNSGPDPTIPFRLGGLRIGETIGHFKQRFPGSACVTPIVKRGVPVNRHTLDDPDGSGSLTCCVDDPNLLARFSEFKVLTVEDQCPVLLTSWKQKLVSVRFTVEAPSVEKLLPSFEKTYGPPGQEMRGRPSLQEDDHFIVKDRQAPISLASWRYGEAYSERTLAILSSANGHAQESRLVQVEMWTPWTPW